mmetsp:Transcript_1002/g.2212  ORF Transcript_1002/g.2212 Transcript_1002/m.2212 type:complete len:144 (+) Transcript_1002:48-479(+)
MSSAEGGSDDEDTRYTELAELCAKVDECGRNGSAKMKPVQDLLLAMINRNCGRQNQTVLHAAAANGSSDAILCFRKFGADISAKDGKENIPLYHAAYNNHLEAVNILLKHGADEELKNPTHFPEAGKQIEGFKPYCPAIFASC